MPNLRLAATPFTNGCRRADAGAVPSLAGQYRMITVFAARAKRALCLTNTLKSSPGLAERDIAWFVLGPDKIASNIDDVPDRSTLEKRHTVDGFQAVRIGKDGTLRASQPGRLNSRGLLDAIDQMPMRQRAMQQQQ